MPSSLLVRSSLNYFPAHQPMATNSKHLQSTYTLYLQHLFNWSRIWNPVEHLRWEFFTEIVEGIHKGILDSPCLLILLIYTKPKKKRGKHLDWPRTLILLPWNCASLLKPHSHHPEQHQPPIEQKPTTISLIIYKHLTLTKFRQLTIEKTVGKLPSSWGKTRKFWSHLPLLFPWLTLETKR